MPGVPLSQRLASFLELPDGLTHLRVDYVRRRRFRWIVLLEGVLSLALFVVLLPCLMVAVVILTVTSEGDFDGDIGWSFGFLDGRVWIRWREVHLTLMGRDGVALATHEQRVDDAEDTEALLREVLLAADRAGHVVVEALDTGEELARWFGGRPMLRAPERIDLSRARRVAEEVLTLTEEADSIELRLTRPPRRVWSAILAALLLPLSIWTHNGRAWLAERLSEVRGRPEHWIARVDEGGLRVGTVRGAATPTIRHDRADVLGIHWSAMPGQGDKARTHRRLRIISRIANQDVDVPGPDDLGQAATDLLVDATQRLWGEVGSLARPSVCPYCSTVYLFELDARCPSCGAPPVGAALERSTTSAG